MRSFWKSSFVLFLVLIVGCGKPYVPKQLTPDEIELKNKLAPYTINLKQAFESRGRYVQVAVLDRATKMDGDDRTYSRVLVMQREHLDLDDYGFCLPGKEQSESGDGEVRGGFNGVLFWADQNGNIFFDDVRQPPGTQMVAEWLVENIPGDKVSLHFGGNRCLVIDLLKK